MYGKAQIDRLNGTKSSIEPIQLSAEAVSSGLVIASRSPQDLPRVGLVPPEGLVAEGDPLKIQLHSNIKGIGEATLAEAREWLSNLFQGNPNLFFGISSNGQDWGNLQAYRRIV